MKTEREMLDEVVEQLKQIDIKLGKVEERLNKQNRDIEQIANSNEYWNLISYRRT